MTLESLGLAYPTVTEEHRQSLLKAKELLEAGESKECLQAAILRWLSHATA